MTLLEKMMYEEARNPAETAMKTFQLNPMSSRILTISCSLRRGF